MHCAAWTPVDASMREGERHADTKHECGYLPCRHSMWRYIQYSSIKASSLTTSLKRSIDSHVNPGEMERVGRLAFDAGQIVTGSTSRRSCSEQLSITVVATHVRATASCHARHTAHRSLQKANGLGGFQRVFRRRGQQSLSLASVAFRGLGDVENRSWKGLVARLREVG